MTHNTIGRPMEILLVEDSLTSARLTIGALKNGQVQHRLTWLNDGQECLDFLFQDGIYSHAPRPDLILLDLGLPIKDGREVLQEIKSDDSLLQIPIVVLTSSTKETDKTQSEKLQVEGYMVKPVDIAKFLELVKKLERFWHADMIIPTA